MRSAVEEAGYAVTRLSPCAPPVTLALFAAGLALVFGAATAVGAAVGPVGPAAPLPRTPAPTRHTPTPHPPTPHTRSAPPGPPGRNARSEEEP